MFPEFYIETGKEVKRKSVSYEDSRKIQQSQTSPCKTARLCFHISKKGKIEKEHSIFMVPLNIICPNKHLFTLSM